MSATEEAIALVYAAARAAADRKGHDMVAIDVSQHLAITDAFLIITGSNDRQVKAIVESIEKNLRDLGNKPVRREGERDGRWVLLDFGDIVVHVQHTEEREFYALERLWRDGPSIELPADTYVEPPATDEG